MFEYVLLESGQFLIGADTIELDSTKFETIVKRVLGIYNKYHPIDVLHDLVLLDTIYTFTGTPTPIFISDVIPIGTALPAITFYGISSFSGNALDIKQTFVWKYNRPTLYVPAAGQYNITAVYTHQITTVPNSSPATKEILTIDETDEYFLKLLTGYFLIGLGRSRRAFTLQDLPVTADAADIVGEGITIITEGTQALQEVGSKFYLAWG